MNEQIKEMLIALQKRIENIEKKFDYPVARANEMSDTNANDIEDESNGLMETFETTSQNSSEIEDCNNAIMELYELLNGEEE